MDHAAGILLEAPEATGLASGLPTEGAPPPGAELSRILHIAVPVSVVLAQREMTIESILAIASGTILEFDVSSHADLTLYAGNQPIGRGQAVKVGENFGIRLTKVGTVRARIDAMSSSGPTDEVSPVE